MPGYACVTCGQFHDELPLRYGAPAPALWYSLSEADRRRRARLSSDQCEIDGQHFFIVGNIDIPIVGTDQLFSWSVWVSLSQNNYQRASQLWHTPGRKTEPPDFGWLSTILSPYPDTLNLKTLVHTRPVDQRPYVELEPTDHPLSIEQRTGNTWERVQHIAELILHEPD